MSVDKREIIDSLLSSYLPGTSKNCDDVVSLNTFSKSDLALESEISTFEIKKGLEQRGYECSYIAHEGYLVYVRYKTQQ